MRIHTLETEQVIPRPRAEVFAFFSDAAHLNDITPPWLGFHILTPSPLILHAGALIDYRIRLLGVPVRWRTEITLWDPPVRFVDVQLRGPYRQWIHEHRFEDHPEGTLVRDKVEYAVPGWLLEPLIHRWFVRPKLDEIFSYRRQALTQRLAARPVSQL